jgi:hypothetical protein
MSSSKYLALLIPATALIIMSFMLIASGGARAASVTGTWSSTAGSDGYFDDTWPADFHYNAWLTLYSGGTGTFKLTCTSVTSVQPGWESAYTGVGKTTTVNVDYTTSGSSVTLVVHSTMGGTYTFPLTVSGNRMTGSGSYVDEGYVTNNWAMDLTLGGGGGGGGSGDLGLPDLSSLSAPAAGIAIAGGVVGLAASLLPPPLSLQMPLQPPGTTSGSHLVPADAPMQAPPNGYPPNYPHPQGTSASMNCPFCGMPTLSPFATGWFCTNAMCPARRGNFQGGTHHQYNDMTWRQP